MLVNPIMKGAGQKFTFTNSGYFQYPAEVEIPANVTKLPSGDARGLYNHSEIEKITFAPSSSFTGVNSTFAFGSCTGLKEISLPASLTMIAADMFNGCSSLEEIEIPAGVITVMNSGFKNCTALKKLEYKGIPTSTYFTKTDGANPVATCTALEQVIFPTGWNQDIVISTGINGWTNVLTHDSLVAMIAALYDFSGGDAHTLTIGATNLARLSAEEIAVATVKNWTLA